MGAITPEERAAVRLRSPIGGKYDIALNRESAYEILGRRAAAPEPAGTGRSQPAESAERPAEPAAEQGGVISDVLWGSKRRQGLVEAMAKQAARTVGSQIGRQILRGVLGGILGGTRRR
jgi:hypothetical protein